MEFTVKIDTKIRVIIQNIITINNIIRTKKIQFCFIIDTTQICIYSIHTTDIWWEGRGWGGGGKGGGGALYTINDYFLHY
jgi:hypothetical protein